MEHSTRRVDRTDWRHHAVCRGSDLEMVIDDSGEMTLMIGQLKEICAVCPVVSACFAEAERITEACGRDYAQGIWGGLTLAERDALAGLDLPPRDCPRCGLVCVPISYATELCAVCDPKQKLRFDDYRPRIEQLLAEGATYQQVAEVLRLSRRGLVEACYRWRCKARKSGRAGRRPIKECGTLAAKTRHARRNESWENCACRHVPWRRGKYRGGEAKETNTS